MDQALLIARSGLDVHHKNIEIISNNLANANTVGFKASRGEYEDLPYQIIKQAGSAITESQNTSSGLVMGTGAKLANNKRIFTDGGQISTGGQLDIAISGRGFIQVQPATGGGQPYYTRNGSLTMNEQGQLITQAGYIVQPPITIPAGGGKVEITDDGFVNLYTSTSPTAQQVGQIQLADFINQDGLQPIGENLYQATTGSGPAILGNPMQNGLGKIKQGVLEGSNVNIVAEMVNLIEAQRAFEVTSKAISAVDNMLQYLNQAT
ncbi:MAG: flagellar basal-body rod protein FlgG [Gammaproteobacteria bacterium]